MWSGRGRFPSVRFMSGPPSAAETLLDRGEICKHYEGSRLCCRLWGLAASYIMQTQSLTAGLQLTGRLGVERGVNGPSPAASMTDCPDPPNPNRLSEWNRCRWTEVLQDYRSTLTEFSLSLFTWGWRWRDEASKSVCLCDLMQNKWEKQTNGSHSVPRRLHSSLQHQHKPTASSRS